MGTAVIRKCREDETARVGQFYDRVIAWLNDHVNYPRWIYRVYPSERSVRIFAKTGSQYICEDGDAILGAFALNDEPQGSYRNGKWSRELADGTYMVIHALAIDPGTQRQGLGSRIIRYCADRAGSGGYGAIRVDIVPDNTPARRLFEKNGFIYAGDADLELDIGQIPAFSLYELDLRAHVHGGSCRAEGVLSGNTEDERK